MVVATVTKKNGEQLDIGIELDFWTNVKSYIWRLHPNEFEQYLPEEAMHADIRRFSYSKDSNDEWFYHEPPDHGQAIRKTRKILEAARPSYLRSY